MKPLRVEYSQEIETLFESLEFKIRKHIKQTGIDERDDLEQEIKIKIMEKVPVLMKEEVPSFFEFALEAID